MTHEDTEGPGACFRAEVTPEEDCPSTLCIGPRLAYSSRDLRTLRAVHGGRGAIERGREGWDGHALPAPPLIL